MLFEQDTIARRWYVSSVLVLLARFSHCMRFLQHIVLCKDIGTKKRHLHCCKCLDFLLASPRGFEPLSTA